MELYQLKIRWGSTDQTVASSRTQIFSGWATIQKGSDPELVSPNCRTENAYQQEYFLLRTFYFQRNRQQYKQLKLSAYSAKIQTYQNGREAGELNF